MNKSTIEDIIENLNRYKFISKRLREIISKNPRAAYTWARITQKPFPEGEKAIATDGVYSAAYAKYVLNAPFILGEKSIARAQTLLKDKQRADSWRKDYLYKFPERTEAIDALRIKRKKKG